jgi:WD40 repeat protein
VAFSPDGKTLATVTESAELKLWNPHTGELIRTFTGEMFRMQSVCFSKDGQKVAAAGGSFDNTRYGKAAVWNVETGQQQIVVGDMPEPAIGVAFAPKGDVLATGAWDGSVRLWDASNGQLQRRINTNARLESVQFSGDGTQVLTTGFTNSAQVFEAATGRQLANLPHEAMTIFADYSADGKTIYSAGEGKVVRLWDAKTFQQIAVLSPESGENEPSAVLAVSYSPDGKWIASSHQDATVRIRDSVSHEVKAVIKGHEDVVSAVTFSPTQQTLATAKYDGTFKMWDNETGRELNK